MMASERLYCNATLKYLFVGIGLLMGDDDIQLWISRKNMVKEVQVCKLILNIIYQKNLKSNEPQKMTFEFWVLTFRSNTLRSLLTNGIGFDYI